MPHMMVIGTPLYQWEVGRQIRIIPVQNMAIDRVHFSNPGDAEALVVKPKEVDGMIVADIPNILLQNGSNIIAYSVHVSGESVETIRECVFSVNKRAKPADYVYTETELADYKRIAEQYAANIHYEQTLKSVQDVLTPLVQNLDFMTYREKTQIVSGYKLSFGEGCRFYFSGIRISNVTLSGVEELIFYIKTPLPAGRKDNFNFNAITFRVGDRCHSSSGNRSGNFVSGVMSITEDFLDLPYFENDDVKKPTKEELSLIPVDVCAEITSFYDNMLSGSIYVNNEAVAEALVTLGVVIDVYAVKYYTLTDLADALDIVNGEVI